MKNIKNKFTTIGIIITTIILAGVAIFTAYRLYTTRYTAVAPNAPQSNPRAAAEGNTCNLSFTLTPDTTPTSTATSTATATATSTATATATATAVPQCDVSCTTDTQCPSNLSCYIPSGQTAGNCRNNSCSTSSSCLCATPTATATATSTATATATATSNPACNNACTSNSNCPSGLMCYIPTGETAGSCRNTQCLTEGDCLCATPTATATATSNPSCNNACTSNSNCPSGLMCYIANGATSGSCRNTQCLTEGDCLCAAATATATAVPTQPALPDAGTSWPTILGTGFGILVIIGSLLLAL